MTLSNYSLFHLYPAFGDENPIANMMLTVSDMDDYTNWDQDAFLMINEDSEIPLDGLH